MQVSLLASTPGFFLSHALQPQGSPRGDPCHQGLSMAYSGLEEVRSLEGISEKN